VPPCTTFMHDDFTLFVNPTWTVRVDQYKYPSAAKCRCLPVEVAPAVGVQRGYVMGNCCSEHRQETGICKAHMSYLHFLLAYLSISYRCIFMCVIYKRPGMQDAGNLTLGDKLQDVAADRSCVIGSSAALKSSLCQKPAHTIFGLVRRAVHLFCTDLISLRNTCPV
jgi:hypothetical protein